MVVEEGKTFDDYYPSSWLRAPDLPDKNPVLTISDVSVQLVGEDQEQKLVIDFLEIRKGLVLNKTNGGTLADLYGSNPNNWINKSVELFTEPVTFKGKVTRGIRIMPTIPEKSVSQTTPEKPEAPENWPE